MQNFPTKKTALLIIDMQNDFLTGPLAVEGVSKTIEATEIFLKKCREQSLTIVHCKREHKSDGSDVELFRKELFNPKNQTGLTVEGTYGAQIIEELVPKIGEHIIIKKRFSAFFQTSLHENLQILGIKNILIAGTQYPNCIRSTAVDALQYDYSVSILTDLCSAKTKSVADANIYDFEMMHIPCILSSCISLC